MEGEAVERSACAHAWAGFLLLLSGTGEGADTWIKPGREAASAWTNCQAASTFGHRHAIQTIVAVRTDSTTAKSL